MTLRPHQQRAIADVRVAMRSHRRVLLVMPTGAGKTHTAAVLIASAVARGRRVLFLVHRREIVMDTHRRLSASGVACGLVMAGSPTTDASVQVASVQTVVAREALPPADFVIWDEAHHTAAESYRTIAAAYPDAYHLGLTATPERADGAGLRDAFDELVVGATVRELTDAGLLAPCDVIAPPMRQDGVAEDPADAWRRLAGGRPTVAFCRSVAESKALARAIGPRARHIDGTTSARVRDELLVAFASGDLDVLCNVFVLTEGWDCARAKVCLLARGCGAEGTFLQMVGRVLRPDGAERALVIDLAGVVHEHGLPDEERVFSLDGIRRKARDAREWIRQCLPCGLTVKGATSGLVCARCGNPWPAQTETRVKRADLGAVVTVSRAERQAEYERLETIARERGYKPAWAGVRFKERFGFWPRAQARAQAGAT